MGRWASFVVVTGLVALTSTAGVPSYADEPAAACRDGVTVVVDHGALGGGVTADCRGLAPGEDADSLFRENGLELEYVRQQPTFICRVNGEPAADPCVMTPSQDAYWGLWWSDGQEPTWRYATVAASGLIVPAGGAVALAWQDTVERVPPDVSAPVAGAGTSATSGSADSADSAAEDGTGEQSGLPAWVGPIAVLAVAAAGAVVVLLRRRVRS